MDKLFSKIKKKIILNKPKIFCITEAIHWDTFSLKLHFKIIKFLIEQNIIDTITWERFNIIDGIILDYYIKNNTNYDIFYISNLLLDGGIYFHRPSDDIFGLINWIKLFNQKNNNKINIVGSDAITFYLDRKQKTIDLLYEIYGKDIDKIKKFILLQYKQIIHGYKENVLSNIKLLEKLNFENNELNFMVYSLKLSLYDVPITLGDVSFKNKENIRFKLLFETCKFYYEKYKNLFYAGYHLSKAEYDIGPKIEKLCGKNYFQSWAIVAYNIYHFKIIFYQGNNDKSEIKKIKKTNLVKYIGRSPFIEKYGKGYHLINSKFDKGKIFFGGAEVPIFLSTKPAAKENFEVDIKSFDYIIIIPLAKNY